MLVAALAVMSLIPRMVGLGTFTSIDEPFWLRQGANFYYALGQREFQNTIYEYHPAVTTMWIIAMGMLIYFPQYRALGQGYLKPGKFDLFLPPHGKDPLELLIVSRAIQVVIIVILLVAVYFLLRLLFKRRTAFLATGFVSASPFVLGHSRLLSHEALMGLFILVSFLSLFAYLHVGARWWLLATSFITAALAQLTKSSGILLLPLVIFMLLVQAFLPGQRSLGRRLLSASKILALWLAGTAVSYFLFWPGMWVAPGAMLSDVYGNALSYTFEGARLSVVPGVQTTGIQWGSLLAGLGFYLNDIVWRTTPLSWLGILLGLVFALQAQCRHQDLAFRLIVVFCLLLGAAYVVMFGYQRGPKPPHYVLTTYLALDLIAGLAAGKLLDALLQHVGAQRRNIAVAGAIVGILGIQFGCALQAYPYFISYYNPIAEALEPGIQNPTLIATGYGVGLEQAAAYLDQKPDAAQMSVMSANGYGSFSYYFRGRTVPMNYLVLTDPALLSVLRESDYAVVDYYNQRRNGTAGSLEGVMPEKTIEVNGIDFLHIYRARDLLMHADQLRP
jgi:hypothetical protein